MEASVVPKAHVVGHDLRIAPDRGEVVDAVLLDLVDRRQIGWPSVP